MRNLLLFGVDGIEGGFNEASYIAELDDELRILDWSLVRAPELERRAYQK